MGDHEHDGTPHVVKYIEAKSGASFAFRLNSLGYRITGDKNRTYEWYTSYVKAHLLVDGTRLKVHGGGVWYNDHYQS